MKSLGSEPIPVQQFNHEYLRDILPCFVKRVIIKRHKRFHMFKRQTTFMLLTLSKNIPNYFKCTSHMHFNFSNKYGLLIR